MISNKYPKHNCERLLLSPKRRKTNEMSDFGFQKDERMMMTFPHDKEIEMDSDRFVRNYKEARRSLNKDTSSSNKWCDEEWETLRCSLFAIFEWLGSGDSVGEQALMLSLSGVGRMPSHIWNQLGDLPILANSLSIIPPHQKTAVKRYISFLLRTMLPYANSV